MKCISCGNELPEGTTSCPFCGNTVLPTNHNVVNGTVQNNNGIPVTPDTPVLPQDQNLNEQNNMMSSNGEMNQGKVDMPTPPQNLGGQMNGVQEGLPGQMAQNTMSQGDVMQATPVPPMTDAQPSAMGPQTLSNQGEIGDGVKIASTAAPVIEGKKNKKVVIIIAVIFVVVAIAAGIGVYYYMSQYKSADKRIDAVFSGMNKFAAGLKAEKIEAKSGTYDIGFSLVAGDDSIDGKIDGKYAYDLEKKIMDYSLNISKLDMKMEGEDLQLIDKEPLKLELYTAESRAYVLLENFYENYIYSDIE
ncbi:MAG: hypothetical protein K2I70_00545, partial [Bacilli bacterium]|nr:hypothetical protein [Bacilli bacterium]